MMVERIETGFYLILETRNLYRRFTLLDSLILVVYHGKARGVVYILNNDMALSTRDNAIRSLRT